MSSSAYQNIGIGLLVLAAMVLYLNKNYKFGTYLALAVILILTIFFPFAGFLIAVPVAIFVWLTGSPAIWETWEKLKNQSIREVA